MKRNALAFLLSLICASAALADPPPPEPYDYDMPHGQFVLHGDAKAGKVVLSKMTDGVPVALWEIPYWMQPIGINISPDGQNLVLHIFPITVAGVDQEVLRFYHQGTVIHHWQLRDFFSSMDGLSKTTMHTIWTRSGSWNGNVYSLTLSDGRIVNFDSATGELQK